MSKCQIDVKVLTSILLSFLTCFLCQLMTSIWRHINIKCPLGRDSHIVLSKRTWWWPTELYHRAVDIGSAVYFYFLHFFLQKLKKWHQCNFFYQNGPQHACTTYLFKHLLQLLWNKRRVLASFFVIESDLMMLTPTKGDKSAIQKQIMLLILQWWFHFYQ